MGMNQMILDDVELNVKNVSKKIIALRIIFIILLIANLALIWFNSSKVGDDSDKISKSISGTVANKTVKNYDSLSTEKQEKKLEKLDEKIREFAHSAEYIPIGFLILGLLVTFLNCNKLHSLKLLVITFLFTAVVAFLLALGDETHQLFVNGRSFQMEDIGLDLLGVLIGYVFSFLFFIAFKRKKVR